MQITKIDSDDRVTIQIPAEFNFKVHHDFRQAYSTEATNRRFDVDLGQVKHMDSSALGMLLLLYQHCGESKDNLYLINCSPQIKKIFEVARFHEFFNIN